MAMKQRTVLTNTNPFNKIERDRKEREELGLLNARRAQRQAKLNKINQEIDELTKKKEEHLKVIGNLKTQEARIRANQAQEIAEVAAEEPIYKKKKKHFRIRSFVEIGFMTVAGAALITTTILTTPLWAPIVCFAGFVTAGVSALWETRPWSKLSKMMQRRKRIKNKAYDVEVLKVQDKQKEEISCWYHVWR